MSKKFIFLIEMKKESLLGAGLILELNGYKVKITGKSENPTKKILHLETSDTPVDLLISDVPVSLLAEMGVTDISGKSKRTLPGILITGNTGRNIRRKFENKGFFFMDKPVNPDELLKTVAAVLGEGKKGPVK